MAVPSRNQVDLAESRLIGKFLNIGFAFANLQAFIVLCDFSRDRIL